MFWPQAVTADPFTEDRKKVIDEDEQTTKNSNAISELLASFQIIKTQNIQKCLQQICINDQIGSRSVNYDPLE